MRESCSGRKAYAPPKLTRFGDVATLTASGMGSKVETNTTGQGNKRPPV